MVHDTAPVPQTHQQRAEQNPTSLADTDHQMAHQFAKWFYEMLNSLSGSYGPHHFYLDCKLEVVSVMPDIKKDHYCGADIVARRLKAFKLEEQLTFNPNLAASGLRGQSSPHGLFKALVCGTVHQNGQVLGIFEQQFGLVKDPDMNQNWRIKFTNLKLGRAQTNEVPTLEHTSRQLSLQM